jgi:hypothetical protein
MMNFRTAATCVGVLFVLLIGLAFSRLLPPPQVDTAQTLATSAVSSHMPPPSFDQ